MHHTFSILYEQITWTEQGCGAWFVSYWYDSLMTLGLTLEELQLRS